MPVPGTSLSSLRPLIQGTHGVVVSGHPSASMAGIEILRRGGNAIDAGVATGLALNVVHSHECSFLGVAPIIMYLADRKMVTSIDGLGVWPKAASLEYFQRAHGGEMPMGILRAVTPGAADAWFTALGNYGTMSFAEVAGPAIQLADEGFPVSRQLADSVRNVPALSEMWASNTNVYLPGGRYPALGELFFLKELAASLRWLAEVEEAHRSLGREGAMMAARDLVYKGELAEKIAAFCQAEGGLLTVEDLSGHSARSEPPVTVRYKGYDVYACGPWEQGPVFPQAVKILEGFDLPQMGHNSADYIHTVSQALNLAFADRESYIGDPNFVDVPIDALLSEEYLTLRRSLIDAARAWPEMPPPGDPYKLKPVLQGTPRSPGEALSVMETLGQEGGDTTHFAVIDSHGNIFSCTASDGAKTGIIIPGTGLALSLRGSQSKLEAGHPAAIAPEKRPRLTPAPALVLRDGEPVMALGGHGGDHIPQGTLQVFLNMAEFGLDAQEAVEEPRFYSYSFPNSSYPYKYEPGVVRLEGRIPGEVMNELVARGHNVQAHPDWWEGACFYSAITRDPRTGILQGGADPRGGGYAVGF